MKKFICLLLSVFAVLSFSACGETGGSNTDVTTGTFEYELVTVENDSGEEENYYEITGLNVSDEDATKVANGDYEDIMIDLKIPATLGEGKEEYPVKSIADGAFTGQLLIKSVTVEKNADGEYNLETINSAAFTGCTNITSMVLPFVGMNKDAVNSKRLFGYIFGEMEATGATAVAQTYNEAGDSASFYIPTTLKEVTIDGQKVIPAYAFYNVAGVEKFTLVGAEKISKFAFYGCSAMTQFEIPTGVTELGESAFEACTSLLTVAMPESLDAIYQNAFKGCTSLGYGRIAPQVIKLTASQVYEGAFSGCTSLRSVEINSEKIYQNTFYGCTALEFVKLGTDIVEIQTNAFLNCEKLVKANVTGLTSSITIWASAFDFEV